MPSIIVACRELMMDAELVSDLLPVCLELLMAEIN